MVEGKLAGLLGRSSGYVEALPLAVRHRVDGLQGLQVEQAKIENEFQAELLELEKKYLKKYTPLYEQRASIIAGKQEPSDDLVEKGKKVDEDEEDSEDDEDEVEPKVQRPKPTQAEIDAAPKVSSDGASQTSSDYVYHNVTGYSRVLVDSTQEPFRSI